MTPFKKNLQRFFIFFFTALSALIVIVGINRIKKAPLVSEVPTPTPPSAPTGTTNESAGAASTAPTGPGGVQSFTGKTYRTPYGDVAAAIEVKGSKIVAVTMPQTPDSPPSVYAKPYLIDQAIKAGSANIQGVSGATYTSLAFKSSLESAIAQVGAQGGTVTPTSSSANTAAPTAKPSVPRRYRNDDRFELFED